MVTNNNLKIMSGLYEDSCGSRSIALKEPENTDKWCIINKHGVYYSNCWVTISDYYDWRNASTEEIEKLKRIMKKQDFENYLKYFSNNDLIHELW